MGKLDGKVALVTGGGSGIGRATALLFAQEGAKVAVADYVPAGGKETVKMITDAGGQAVFIEADVSRAADVKRMVNTTVDTYGRIDILYNNAGIQKYALTVDVSEEDWAKMLDTNLTSVFLASKYTIPYMLKQGGGVIISTASAQGFSGNIGTGPYTVAKAGIISLTKTMAAEYAKANIRVNCICPGVIDTPMGGPWIPMVRMDLIPQGKAGKPEDIAKAALYLASDDSSYVTGHPLVVDGGWVCQIILPMKDQFASK